MLLSLKSCNQKINEIHSSISNITSAIGDVLDAKAYWKDSVSEAQKINEKTTHMQRLVKAGKGKSSIFSSSKSTKHIVNNYESSWETVKNVLGKAFLNKITITFTCTFCKTLQTSLPYIDSSDNFVCEECHYSVNYQSSTSTYCQPIKDPLVNPIMFIFGILLLFIVCCSFFVLYYT